VNFWPCVTDNSGITTYGLMALVREMSTPSKLQYGVWHTTLFTCVFNAPAEGLEPLELIEYRRRGQKKLGWWATRWLKKF